MTKGFSGQRNSYKITKFLQNEYVGSGEADWNYILEILDNMLSSLGKGV